MRPCRAEGLAETFFFLGGLAERAEVVENAERWAEDSEVEEEISMEARERERQREHIECDIVACTVDKANASIHAAMPNASMNARLRDGSLSPSPQLLPPPRSGLTPNAALTSPFYIILAFSHRSL